MKKYLYMAVAAIAALSSCSKNEPIIDETGKQALIFTATMESDATRATYDSNEKCASWEKDDSISINGIKYIAQSAGLTTTFKPKYDLEYAEGSTYNAYFACIYYRNRWDRWISALPGAINETWANGKFNMPMYATSEATNLEFKNLCGVLKITVPSNEIAAVKKIKVSSANMAMSGEFTVNSNNAAELINSNSNYVNNTFTVTYTNAVQTTAGGTVFYVAVPAQTYQGLRIRLDADGNGFTKSMTTTAGKNITVERNKIYPITFAHNGATPTSRAGTTGTAEATINEVGVNVNWVQLWAGGPKFAEKNVGANDSTEAGDWMMFNAAAAEGASYVWGTNWRTPSKDEMEELVKAAAGAGSEKVECDYVMIGNGKWGFRFTGKENGYTGNSVLFPVKYTVKTDVFSYGDIYGATVHYWSKTPEDNQGYEASFMGLSYDVINGWRSRLVVSLQGGSRLVRPVLKGAQENN